MDQSKKYLIELFDKRLSSNDFVNPSNRSGDVGISLEIISQLKLINMRKYISTADRENCMKALRHRETDTTKK